MENEIQLRRDESIDSQITTARAYPRNLKRCIDNIELAISLDKEFAEQCIYSLRKGKAITGPSVHLAKLIAQEFGNMRIEQKVLGADATHVSAEAIAFDLEKNIAIRTQTKRSIVGSSGRYSDDLITITGNAASSIALRNAIFSVIPQPVIKKIMKTVNKAIVGDISTEEKLKLKRDALIKNLLENYASKKLTEDEILSSIGKSSVSHINESDIITLIGYERTIKEGEQTFESIFRPESVKPRPQIDQSSKEKERLISLLKNCKTKEDLKKYEVHCKSPDLKKLYDELYKSF